MKKSFFAVILIAALMMVIGLTACSQGNQESASASSEAASEEAAAESSEAASDEAADESSEAASEEAADEAADEPEADSAAYGYAGDDPIEAAVYKYLAEEVSKNFDKADVSIPTVSIVYEDLTNPDEVLVSGDFWVDNYNIKGDTLECVSGGNFPGVMHLVKNVDGYVVSSFDKVADGADFEASAKELFGDSYEDFMSVYSDDEAHKELRTITVSDYVNLNGLDVTQYQDSGWDPVQLYKQ